MGPRVPVALVRSDVIGDSGHRRDHTDPSLGSPAQSGAGATRPRRRSLTFVSHSPSSETTRRPVATRAQTQTRRHVRIEPRRAEEWGRSVRYWYQTRPLL